MAGKPVSIALFARAPIPGKCKTRLIPALGPDGAARLHRHLVRHSLRTAAEADVGAVTLWTCDGPEQPFFQALAKTFDCRVLAQQGRDLGERMHHAFAHHLPTSPTLLMGTDIPSLGAADLRAAASALLTGRDAFLIGVADGGYGLLGLRGTLSTELFTGIGWGGSEVLAESRRRIRRLGMTLAEGDPRWDVDTPDDLVRLFSSRLDFLCERNDNGPSVEFAGAVCSG